MQEFNLSVRELQLSDLDSIIDYWLNSKPSFLEAMGVDLSKIPLREQWEEMLNEQIEQPYIEKKSYCTIWLLNGAAIGHCNVNKIIFGEEAFMHLHIWKAKNRKLGVGTALVKKSLPLFFRNLDLKKIYCEPYALNPSPNKTLKKVGFEFVKTHITTPGWLNFEQPVNLWQLTFEKFKTINFPS